MSTRISHRCTQIAFLISILICASRAFSQEKKVGPATVSKEETEVSVNTLFEVKSEMVQLSTKQGKAIKKITNPKGDKKLIYGVAGTTQSQQVLDRSTTSTAGEGFVEVQVGEPGNQVTIHGGVNTSLATDSNQGGISKPEGSTLNARIQKDSKGKLGPFEVDTRIGAGLQGLPVQSSPQYPGAINSPGVATFASGVKVQQKIDPGKCGAFAENKVTGEMPNLAMAKESDTLRAGLSVDQQLGIQCGLASVLGLQDGKVTLAPMFCIHYDAGMGMSKAEVDSFCKGFSVRYEDAGRSAGVNFRQSNVRGDNTETVGVEMARKLGITGSAAKITLSNEKRQFATGQQAQGFRAMAEVKVLDTRQIEKGYKTLKGYFSGDSR